MKRAYLSWLTLLAACGAFEGPPEQAGRGVLVIAVDALRWDHTSFANYGRDTMPRLAEWFEQEGVVFTDAWSAGPQILPAHIALLTGCDPTVARRPEVVLSDGRRLPPVTDWFVPELVPTLADEFLGDGWHTAAFVDHVFLEERRGVERGFREFEGVSRGWGTDTKSGLAGVAKRFVGWAGDLDDDEDWFAYVHFNDLEAMWSERWRRDGPGLAVRFGPRPDLDYVPPVALRSPCYFALPASRMLEGSPTLGEYEVQYDSALWWLDRNLRRLIGMLDQRGRLDRTTIVIVGTFGLGFGEAGLLVDSGTLAPVDLRVPLLVRPAPELGIEAGARIDELVGHADLAPTLLALHGLATPAGMHGKSLVPLLRGRAEPVHDALFASHSITPGFSVVTEERHYVWWDPRGRGQGGALTQSWYGEPRPDDTDGVRISVSRSRPARLWLAGEVTAQDPLGLELHAKGEAWYEDLDRARHVLHPSTWNAEARSEEVLEDLRSKGLIAEER